MTEKIDLIGPGIMGQPMGMLEADNSVSIG